MGVSGISIWQLLIVLAIVVMIFGTKKLRNMGGDLGSAVKGFKNAMGGEGDKKEDDNKGEDQKIEAKSESAQGQTQSNKQADKQ